MSIRSKLIVAGLLLLALAAARADGLSGSISPQLGGGISQGFDGGINNFTTAAAPPTSCGNGTLDLSLGCATPLVGNF